MKQAVIHADYRKISDEELIYRFVHRQDHLAISAIFERYGHQVFGVCCKYLKDGEAAKDATQQIFIKLLDDLHRFKIEKFKPWLLQVTRNFCLMELRGKIKVVNNEFITQQHVESEGDLHLHIEKEEMLNYLEEAIEWLSLEQRTCIKLFYLNKKTYAEIAEITGYDTQQVKSYLQNGKRNLKIKIEALQAVKR